MEILVTIAVISYIIYLRYYADLRTDADKELAQLQVGIKLFNTGQFDAAYQYFEQAVRDHPQWSVAYLYRARCHHKLGDAEAALADLRTGESYDDTVPDIHVEIGRILYDRLDYNAAFTEFDKAVFHAQGRDAMSYYWRGLTRQKLRQPQEAQHDLDRAIALEQKGQNRPDVTPASTEFFDKRLLTNAAFVLLHSVLLLIVIKRSPVIHWPYLMAAISAAAIGFAEPRKGWALAVLQALALWIGWTVFTKAPTRGGQRELEAFSLYGSMILTFVGSFIGSVLKRAMG